jgi:hypothetical protein
MNRDTTTFPKSSSPGRPVPKAGRKVQNAALGTGQHDSTMTLVPHHGVVTKMHGGRHRRVKTRERLPTPEHVVGRPALEEIASTIDPAIEAGSASDPQTVSMRRVVV